MELKLTEARKKKQCCMFHQNVKIKHKLLWKKRISSLRYMTVIDEKHRGWKTMLLFKNLMRLFKNKALVTINSNDINSPTAQLKTIRFINICFKITFVCLLHAAFLKISGFCGKFPTQGNIHFIFWSVYYTLCPEDFYNFS